MLGNTRITPPRVKIGQAVEIAFDVTNTTALRQRVLVDFCIHVMKANGKTRAKVFKLKTLDLAPRQTAAMKKTVSLAEMTTRKHYAGTHPVEVVLNGHARPLGRFDLVPS